VTCGKDIAGRLEVALEVVDFEALVEILRGVLMGENFNNELEEDSAEDFLEGLWLEFLESLSRDEFCDGLFESLSEKDWDDSRGEDGE
jgi:hypothetical protein